MENSYDCILFFTVNFYNSGIGVRWGELLYENTKIRNREITSAGSTGK